MKKRIQFTLLAIALAVFAGTAQAKVSGLPDFTGFSTERGATLYQATHTGGKQGTGSCTVCHGTSPQDTGQTRAGKTIEPMAVSKNPARYTDKANIEKWFTRNCQDVLGRACTAKEKGDFLTYMMGQ